MSLPLVPVDAVQDGGFFAVDAGFEGKGAVETPLGGGDAFDHEFFAVADGAGAEEGLRVFSPSRMKYLSPERRWVRPLRLEAALPSGVRGPVDFWALRQLESVWFDFTIDALSLSG